jgi:hypothetical protein
MAELEIVINKFIPEFFSTIFQQGVNVKIRAGISVRNFLCGNLGLSSEYVENRISTIFLDGKPIDSLYSSHIKNKSTISLSAAMPGLVGATMRRGGFYASFRNTITYRDDGNGTEVDGIVRIKLFNIIIKEIGADLLRKGIYITCYDLKLLIKPDADKFIKNCLNVIIDGKKINPERLRDNGILDKCEIVQLILKSDSRS